MIIRRAAIADAHQLTTISFASKNHWQYPERFFTVWKDELTITPQYITDNLVFTSEIENIIVGYYSLVSLKADLKFEGQILEKGFWLEHMFLAPAHIGRSLGKQLFDHAMLICKGLGVNRLKILSDPHARGFYEKMGCRFIKELPSSIAGRTTPLLVKQ